MLLRENDFDQVMGSPVVGWIDGAVGARAPDLIWVLGRHWSSGDVMAYRVDPVDLIAAARSIAAVHPDPEWRQKV